MWLFQDGGKWKFHLRAIDPANGRLALPAMTADPNISGGDWFPAAKFDGGYFTAGVVKIDPTGKQKVVEPADLFVRRFRVAAQPASTKGKA